MFNIDCFLRMNIYSFILILISICDLDLAQTYSITISAGAFDRSESIVSFSFPDDVQKGIYQMTDGNGESVRVQVEENNKAWFILRELNAGASKVYIINTATPDNRNSLSIVTKIIDENTISFQSAGRDILSYYHGHNEPPAELDVRYRRGGYIHPVYSPNGVLLTNHLNVDAHPHHSGIWSAWTNTSFQGRTPDFWNIHNNTGRVDQADSLHIAWEGPVQAGFRAKHYFVDLSASEPVIALNEQWEVNVYPLTENGSYHLFDLTLTQTANTNQPLILPEYRYGGVGFRGHIDWDDPDNVTFLTSDGLGRDGHGTRGRWCHIGGRSKGELAGITIMSHPENFRHPQTMRIHPTEPFFNYAPQQLGSMSIKPGEPYVVRYRYVTYDGEPNPKALDRLWNDYAYPPGVTVEKQ